MHSSVVGSVELSQASGTWADRAIQLVFEQTHSGTRGHQCDEVMGIGQKEPRTYPQEKRDSEPGASFWTFLAGICIGVTVTVMVRKLIPSPNSPKTNDGERIPPVRGTFYNLTTKALGTRSPEERTAVRFSSRPLSFSPCASSRMDSVRRISEASRKTVWFGQMVESFSHSSVSDLTTMSPPGLSSDRRVCPIGKFLYSFVFRDVSNHEPKRREQERG